MASLAPPPPPPSPPHKFLVTGLIIEYSLTSLLLATLSGWFSGHQPCLPPLRPGLNSGLGSYVGRVSVGFLRVLRFFSLIKIVSRPISSGCGAVLRGHTWIVFRGRAPSRQHSSFGPTSMSCALSKSVSDCGKGRLAGQILLKTIFYTPFASYFNFAIHKLVRIQFRKLLFVIGFP